MSTDYFERIHSEFNFLYKLLQPEYNKILENLFDKNALTAPAVAEIDPTTYCNLACPFCISSEIIQKRTFIPIDPLLNLLAYLKNYGTKAIILSGGGEPLLHPNFSAKHKCIYIYKNTS